MSTGWLILGADQARVQAKLQHYFPEGLEQRYSGPWRSFVVALTPAEAVTYFQSLADAGIQYFIVETLDAADVETIRLLAEEVMPRVIFRDILIGTQGRACGEQLMARSSNPIEVYLEIGKKRTFAGAIDWPGWCRIGRDEGAALQALVDSGPRYAHVLRGAGLGFHAPTDASAFAVVERLAGNATTDFGAPDVAPSSDTRPVDGAELRRFQRLLQAYWRAFDAAVQAAAGKELRKGPRGGGRDLEGIVRHVLNAEGSYLARLAWKREQRAAEDLREELDRTRQAVLNALAATAHGQVPAHGPRGGVIWTPRYFVRRLGWHVLDHLWEIEDRVT